MRARMLDVAVQNDGVWPGDTNWEAIAVRAVTAAIAHSPYQQYIEMDATFEIGVKLTSDAEAVGSAASREREGQYVSIAGGGVLLKKTQRKNQTCEEI